MTLDEARESIGQGVIYLPRSREGMEHAEAGVISSVNDHYVFVRYGSDRGTKATYPEDLTLEFGGALLN